MASGDKIVVASQEYVDKAISANGSVDEYTLISDDYTASAGNCLAIDTLDKEIRVDLPSGDDNIEIKFLDIESNFNTNNLVIYPASDENIMGYTNNEKLVCDISNISFTLKYINNNWRVL